MKSPAILGLNESTIGSDMKSIAAMKTPFCSEESDLSSTEPDMESTADKKANISIDKDSGIDSDNDFKAPDSELMVKIVTQVESYFSDDNLKKDEFVLKHIRRNKEGYISLKLLSSFRKVKALTKNWKVVAHCVKLGSKTLELNEDETKIRRKTPLPAVDGDKYSRTVIAFNFGVGNDDVDSISKIFGKYGDIALIRILKSGSSSAIPQHLMNKIKEKCDLSKTTVSTIEYINKSDAENAFKCMQTNANNNWRNGIQVMYIKSSNTTKNNKNSFKSNEHQKNIDLRDNQRSYPEKSLIKQNSNGINICLDINNIGNKRHFFGRQKSKSYSSGDDCRVFQKFSNLPINNKSDNRFLIRPQTNVAVIRYPLGPDGTNGFNSYRNHRSPTF